MTSDGGATWTKPKGIEGLNHAHGCSQLYQTGQTLFIGGGGAPMGNGIYRSTDLGANWTRVTDGNVSVVWGTSKMVYGMWGWACASCGLNEGGPQYQTAPQPGDMGAWSKGPALPDGPRVGPEQRRRDVRRHAQRLRGLDVGHGAVALRRAVATRPRVRPPRALQPHSQWQRRSSRSSPHPGHPRNQVNAPRNPTPRAPKSRGCAMNVAPGMRRRSIVGSVGVGADHQGAGTDARLRNRSDESRAVTPGGVIVTTTSGSPSPAFGNACSGAPPAGGVAVGGSNLGDVISQIEELSSMMST